MLSCILIGRPALRKNPYSDRGPKISVLGPGFFPVLLIALFTAGNILINEINISLICLKTLCVKNKVLSCSTFLYSNQRNHDRRHLNTKCHKNSENDCEPYNKQFIDLACSVCTVKYRTSVFLVRRIITLSITLINNI